MKNSLLFLSLFIFCTISTVAQTPTFADPPGPEHVLVVYKQPTDDTDTLGNVSEDVMEYYVSARNIPGTNILGLEDLVDTVSITHEGVTHLIKLTQQGEIIRDMNNANSPEPSIHSWIYFNDRIA